MSDSTLTSVMIAAFIRLTAAFELYCMWLEANEPPLQVEIVWADWCCLDFGESLSILSGMWLYVWTL